MNENVKLTSDSTCDLTEEMLKKFDISICPIAIILGTEERHDTVDIDAEGVLDFVAKTGILPKTAATPKDDYVEFFKKHTEGGNTVIHFCISSKASSCYNNAVEAAKEVGNVYVIDSYALSGGQGLQILKARDLLNEGKGVEEVVSILKENTKNVQLSFVVDTLEYLHKGGRCSSIALIGSKILKIHPSIFNVDGALTVHKKYMGAHIRCVAQYIADLASEYKNYDDTRVFITHSPADRELVDMAIEKVKELFRFKEIYETETGSTVASHCGRNTLGVLFLNKD